MCEWSYEIKANMLMDAPCWRIPKKAYDWLEGKKTWVLDERKQVEVGF